LITQRHVGKKVAVATVLVTHFHSLSLLVGLTLQEQVKATPQFAAWNNLFEVLGVETCVTDKDLIPRFFIYMYFKPSNFK